MKRIYILLITMIIVACAMARVTEAVSHASMSPSKRKAVIAGIEANMVAVKGGCFVMGATAEQGKFAYEWEKPVHEVFVDDFRICRYEVTQEEWEAVMGSNPSRFKGARHPVERVSWYDCQMFIARLNKLTGKKYRLPTEEEWEYAARGGHKAKTTRYAGSNDIESVAWFDRNSGRRTHNVGGKKPNEIGLYDMSGNVSEWCDGMFDVRYGYAKGENRKLKQRIRRGGSWSRIESFCRNSYRYGRRPDARVETLGLRLAL